jgi:penicillin-binding protein 1A
MDWVARIDWLRFLRLGITSSILAGAFFLGFTAFIFDRSPIDFSVLEQYDPGKPSILLDDQGKEWGRFQLDRRNPVPLTKLPQHLINAFIAAEDWQFFHHSGISFKGIIRSSLINLYHGRIVQGASTITQQLVKLLFFDSQRTFKRKVQEQLCAVLVERQFTKEQILETYLNHIYFGCGIYGVEAAAQRLWNIPVSDLTLDQSAMLAAIVRSPGHFSPLWFPLSGQQRRNVVLHQMLKQKFIDSTTYEKAKGKEIGIKDYTSKVLALHLKETLRTRLESLFGKQRLYSGGLRIKTSLNQKAQRLAERSFRGHVSHLKKELGSEIEGGMLSIDTKTGQIKALIGGFSFSDSQFNRAFQASRQQGSVFKPVLYSTALIDGMSFLDTAVDEPLKVQQGNQLWEPRNHNRKFEGTITLAKACIGPAKGS